jgi:two-component system chemotaxis sensor kinase CheA
MEDLLQEFVVEALELAYEVEENLRALQQRPEQLELLNAVFRAFHTIKGGAGFMGLPTVVDACHLTENLFDALRSGQVSVTPEAVETALGASSFIFDQLTNLSGGALAEQLRAMPMALEQRLSRVMSAPNAVPMTVATAELDWNAFYRALLSPEPAQTQAPEKIPVVALTEPVYVQEAMPAALSLLTAKEDSLRVKAHKLDALLEVAGESVQAMNQASALLDKLMPFKQAPEATLLMAALAETLGRSARYTTELQRATLATRMQPVGRLFQRFPRLIRDLATDLGKQVELVIEGAETEVDRVVVDSLYDPLMHMLRNSLDHGIESVSQRVAMGKPALARITLRAWQEGGIVVIQVADDGAGIDPQRLLQKARAQNLLKDAAEKTHDEQLQLIFLAGLSTKDTASSVSGRGVGMDVVKTSIERHRGTIHLESQRDVGTCISVRLPIELSIIPTMLVNIGEVQVGLPMSAVQRVIELPDNFSGVVGSPVFKNQGLSLPVRSLARVLGYVPEPERLGIVVVAAKPYILAVCGVEGTAEMVIKPMSAIAANGIGGTARSAEGALVLILDLAFLQAGAH